MAGQDPPDRVSIPIDGTLDLHTFAPREVKELVPEYLRECQAAGILRVRIVHGKGTGAMRRQVHALLAQLPEVATFALADGAARVGSRRALLGADHRGRVWEPSQGSHYNVTRHSSPCGRDGRRR